MSDFRNLNRRMFLTDLGRGGLAIAVFGAIPVLAACSDDDTSDEATIVPATARTSSPTVIASASTTEAAQPSSDAPGAVDWTRVNLGSVSAYILVRNGEATVVDTGTRGSADDIEASLITAGIDWNAVGHVILTHSHGDHQGSLPDVLARAPEAAAYAGAGDISSIDSPRALVAVGNGDRVFDLEIIETPGHTPGHISVLDSVGGLLVAGDALNGADGGVIGANPRYTPDMDTANQSIARLAERAFETVVFGHGDPVIGGASAQVAALVG
ncbi:MAG: MBL fold metallo-hydrolase [Dehalococcoidia bacterium]|jgi:glyoxylase-like metal-dependent hydrolase (beta-lactamase superfamily II)|nr:MBL fold metallo-hydrolase [Dehalococcoidia bacterium]